MDCPELIASSDLTGRSQQPLHSTGQNWNVKKFLSTRERPNGALISLQDTSRDSSLCAVLFLERGQRVSRVSTFVLLRPRDGPSVSRFPLAKMPSSRVWERKRERERERAAPAVTVARNLHSAYPRPFAEIEVTYSSPARLNSSCTTYGSLPPFRDRYRD